MNAMKNKIKSQRGASITFALLLFLVCSVVSIVVVVAGSAAAGRMSQRAETDQRYYAVTSAVELLCDDFKGKTVKVEYSTKADTIPSEDAFEVIDIDGDKNKPNNPEYAVLKAVSRKLAMMTAQTNTENDTYELAVTGELPKGSALDCTINEDIRPDGRVIFTVSNKKIEPTTKQYTLQAVFNATISKSTSQYKYEGEEMERVTTTLLWSVNSIQKGA